MNDSACCAHTRILYSCGHYSGGPQFDRWQCADCDARFSPEALFGMKLAAISSASLANTREAKADRIGRENPCWTQAYADVCTAIDREINQRERAESYNRWAKHYEQLWRGQTPPPRAIWIAEEVWNNLQKELNTLQTPAGVPSINTLRPRVVCTFCRKEFTGPDKAEKAREHIETCPQHPLAAVTQERDQFKRSYDDARAKLVYLKNKLGALYFDI